MSKYFEAVNDNLKVQIDDEYSRLILLRKFDLQASGYTTIENHYENWYGSYNDQANKIGRIFIAKFSLNSNDMIVGFRVKKSLPNVGIKMDRIENGYAFIVIYAYTDLDIVSSIVPYIEIMTFGLENVSSPSTNKFGLQIFNSQGQQIFNSNSVLLNVEYVAKLNVGDVDVAQDYTKGVYAPSDITKRLIICNCNPMLIGYSKSGLFPNCINFALNFQDTNISVKSYIVPFWGNETVDKCIFKLIGDATAEYMIINVQNIV